MMPKEDTILSADEISKLNDSGHNLSESKMYLLKFLFNDSQNKANDPIPFKIETKDLEKFAKESIGMPFIVPPYGVDRHIVSESGEPKDLITLQRNYAIGEIVSYIKNDSNNNYYGIIDVWPEFQATVERKLIPQRTSPTFAITQTSTGPMVQQFINLQAVPHGGYEPHLTEITATCKNGLKQCMDELRIYGAAGTITQNRNNPKFINMNNQSDTSVSQEQSQSKNNEDVSKQLEDIAKGVTDISKQVTDITAAFDSNAEILKQVAAKTEGIDVTKITTLSADSSPDMGENTSSVAGAAGQVVQTSSETKKDDDIKNNPAFQSLQQDFDKLKKLSEKREKEIADEKRMMQATQITEARLKLKEIELDKKDETIKYYFDLADENKQPKDLSLLLEDIAKRAVTIAGAAGRPSYTMPQMTGDGSGQSTEKITNATMMEASS